MGLGALKWLGVALAVVAVLYGAMQLGARNDRLKVEARNAETIALLNAKLESLTKTAALASAALKAAETARAELEESLTHEATQDPDAGRISFGADSVQRLNLAR